MNKTEIQDLLKERGVSYNEADTKAVLEQKLLESEESAIDNGSAIDEVSTMELDEERKQIEKIKANEQSVILSPEVFDTERQRVLDSKPNKGNRFNFFAGKDNRGRRIFRVFGFNDKSFVYRGASMDYKETKVYFFGTAYDALFGHNSKDIVTVDAWLLDKKGKYRRTLVAKNEIVMPVSLESSEAEQVINKIREQGDDPNL
jgi:hypothetical protein